MPAGAGIVVLYEESHMKNDMKLKGWLQRFLGWPLYMGILVLAMTAAAYVFELKAGTLYPLLHGMEEKGMLASYEREILGKTRK